VTHSSLPVAGDWEILSSLNGGKRLTDWVVWSDDFPNGSISPAWEERFSDPEPSGGMFGRTLITRGLAVLSLNIGDGFSEGMLFYHLPVLEETSCVAVYSDGALRALQFFFLDTSNLQEKHSDWVKNSQSFILRKLSIRSVDLFAGRDCLPGPGCKTSRGLEYKLVSDVPPSLLSDFGGVEGLLELFVPPGETPVLSAIIKRPERFEGADVARGLAAYFLMRDFSPEQVRVLIDDFFCECEGSDEYISGAEEIVGRYEKHLHDPGYSGQLLVNYRDYLDQQSVNALNKFYAARVVDASGLLPEDHAAIAQASIGQKQVILFPNMLIYQSVRANRETGGLDVQQRNEYPFRASCGRERLLTHKFDRDMTPYVVFDNSVMQLESFLRFMKFKGIEQSAERLFLHCIDLADLPQPERVSDFIGWDGEDFVLPGGRAILSIDSRDSREIFKWFSERPVAESLAEIEEAGTIKAYRRLLRAAQIEQSTEVVRLLLAMGIMGHFGHFNLTKFELNPITILTGVQTSGKTPLLKTIVCGITKCPKTLVDGEAVETKHRMKVQLSKGGFPSCIDETEDMRDSAIKVIKSSTTGGHLIEQTQGRTSGEALKHGHLISTVFMTTNDDVPLLTSSAVNERCIILEFNEQISVCLEFNEAYAEYMSTKFSIFDIFRVAASEQLSVLLPELYEAEEVTNEETGEKFMVWVGWDNRIVTDDEGYPRLVSEADEGRVVKWNRMKLLLERNARRAREAVGKMIAGKTLSAKTQNKMYVLATGNFLARELFEDDPELEADPEDPAPFDNWGLRPLFNLFLDLSEGEVRSESKFCDNLLELAIKMREIGYQEDLLYDLLGQGVATREMVLNKQQMVNEMRTKARLKSGLRKCRYGGAEYVMLDTTFTEQAKQSLGVKLSIKKIANHFSSTEIDFQGNGNGIWVKIWDGFNWGARKQVRCVLLPIHLFEEDSC